jgi:hypothetical protein
MQQSGPGLLWHAAPALPAALFFIVPGFPVVNPPPTVSQLCGFEMEVSRW